MQSNLESRQGNTHGTYGTSIFTTTATTSSTTGSHPSAGTASQPFIARITPPPSATYASSSSGSKILSGLMRSGDSPASKWWALSRKVGLLNRGFTLDNQQHRYPQRKSSESSDVSDQFRYSPPPDSCTPSSEYSRSPRESADSDMLGLSAYCSGLVQTRRSIPSVLVGNNEDAMLTMMGGTGSSGGGGKSGSGNLLSLNDCYMRRGSAGGRALPQVPVEPSR